LGLAQYYWDLLCLFLSVVILLYSITGVSILLVLVNSAELLESFDNRAVGPPGDALSTNSSIGLAM